MRQLCLDLPGQIRQARVVASFSGGLGSAEALERALTRYGRDDVSAVFADVGTVEEDGEIVCGEDEDLYRFLDDVERVLEFPIHRIRHRKYSNIWDAFFGERFMGNSLVDTCSKFLKRQVLDEWIDSFHPGAIRVVGFSWLEKGRGEDFLKYFPDAWFPNCESPYLTNEDIGMKWESRGVARPRLYRQGFSHNNCGGFCVKMGLGQCYDLWRIRPDRYAFHEMMEARFRAEINADATIFRKDGAAITLTELRSLFEKGYVPRTAQRELCGGRCMVPSEDEYSIRRTAA